MDAEKDFLIILTISVLLLRPFDQHFIAPITWCQKASLCNHTGIPECGERSTDSITKTFLDECDLYEYNCDYNEEFNKVDMLICEQATTKNHTETKTNVTFQEKNKETPTTKPQKNDVASNCTRHKNTTNSVITTEASSNTFATTITTKRDISSLGTTDLNGSLSSVTDFTTKELKIENICTRNHSHTPTTQNSSIETVFTTASSILSSTISVLPTSSICTRHKNTTNSMIYSRTEATSNTFATTLKTTNVNQSSSSVIDFTTKEHKIENICTRNHSHTPTTQMSRIESTLPTSSIGSSVLTAPETTKPGVDCTRKEKSIPATQITTQSTTTTASQDGVVTPIIDNELNKQKTTTAVIPSPKTVECTTYPKDCNRPSTWETTSEGETRDFFQILREKFGTRVKLLKATTHWPKQAPFLRIPFDTFKFGRHSDI